MTNEQLIEEARKRYPIGTEYIPFNLDHMFGNPSTVKVVKADHHILYNEIWINSGQWNGVVYRDGIWAKIVNNNGKTINNNSNTNKMSIETTYKNYFKNFKHKEREITLCLRYNNTDQTLSSGYAVKLKEDEFDSSLAKKISIGRAGNSRTNLLPDNPTIDKSIINTYVADAILGSLQHKIVNNIIVIKGIR